VPVNKQPIDYDALARQHGGTAAVDYDALAAQHGGVDISAGLVPNKGGIDLSAGLVPNGTQQTDTRNAFQRGVDYLTTVTPEQRQGHSAAFNALQDFGAGAIQGLAAPFAHPLDTLSGLGNTIAHPIDTAVALGKSVMANPAQAAGNLVGGALLGEAAAPAVAPVANALKQGAGRVVLLGKTPEAAYESALRPSTTLSPAERAEAVQTSLQNKLPVSKNGVERLSELIDDYDQKRQAVIDSDPTRPVSTVKSLRNLDAVRGKFSNQVTPQPDLADIDQVESNFLNNPKIQPQGAGPSPGSLPASEAQAMKSGTYNALGSKAYGEVKGASIEAQKALARGLKEEIAAQFPELDKLNAEESRLLDLQPILERAVSRVSNRESPIGIGGPILGTGVKAVTGSTGLAAVAATMKSVINIPEVQSRLAIAVSRSSKIPYPQALSRVQAYSTALGSAAERSNTAATTKQGEQ
jgi:hypothetical protein